MKFKKICKHCGQEFETNSPQKLYCNNVHYRPCPVCGKDVAMIDNDFSRPPRCCSIECGVILRKSKFKMRKCVVCGEEFIPKTGVQIMCDKVHYKQCEMCGKEFVYTRKHREDGVIVCSKECSKVLTRKRNLAEYGVEHPMQSPQVQKNFHSAMKKKYGVEHALQIPSKVKQQQKAAYLTNMKNNGVPYACLTPQCIKASHNQISNTNKMFGELLSKHNIEYEMEYVIGKKSFDFYLHKHNIVIEIDPTYTHSVKENHFHAKVSESYHIDKSKLSQSRGLRCIHIFDWDDWSDVINILSNKDTIYARKCQLRNLSKLEANLFLDDNHIQGKCSGNTVNLGLYYRNQLVQVMTFGKPRYNKNYEWELLRLCSDTNYRVVGGASKLFKSFVNNHHPESVISYCDLSKFTGQVYLKLGMTYKYTTKPNKIWSKGNRKITDNLLRQRGYDQLFNSNFGKGSSNDELMLKHGWLPVYDCGQSVFVYKVKKGK